MWVLWKADSEMFPEPLGKFSKYKQLWRMKIIGLSKGKFGI